LVILQSILLANALVACTQVFDKDELC